MPRPRKAAAARAVEFFRKIQASTPSAPASFDQNDDRADWWQNILNVGNPILTDLGLPAPQIASIMADAAYDRRVPWGARRFRFPAGSSGLLSRPLSLGSS
ncbi:MAG: hypothetical protein M3Q86_11695 [Verrucomicrobiota bacterium]|nr:hypothetical protein [Verrucomicrobiota bacterium]